MEDTNHPKEEIIGDDNNDDDEEDDFERSSDRYKCFP